MVRKPTLILLIVFALLLGVLFYLQKNPLPSQASLTPSPTPRAQIVPDLMPGDIQMVSLNEKGSGAAILVKKDGEKWLLGEDSKEIIETGKVEQLRSEIAAMKVMTEMPEDMIDSALGLAEPAYTLTIQTASNQTYEVHVGDKTPIENGYYTQVNDGPAVVVSNMPIDTIVSLLKEISAPQATPAP